MLITYIIKTERANPRNGFTPFENNITNNLGPQKPVI